MTSNYLQKGFTRIARIDILKYQKMNNIGIFKIHFLRFCRLVWLCNTHQYTRFIQQIKIFYQTKPKLLTFGFLLSYADNFLAKSSTMTINSRSRTISPSKGYDKQVLLNFANILAVFASSFKNSFA